MDKEKMKLERRRLHQIYLDHDIPKFREFIKDRAHDRPELIPFTGESDQVLSDLMYNMKSQLMYLGPLWQEARNVMRFKQFWSGRRCPIEDIPLCVSCKYFREAPSPEESPCMHMGATPADISCPVYDPI